MISIVFQKAMKEALRKVGVEAEVGNGRGTAWGWLEINIGDPRMRGGLKPLPLNFNIQTDCGFWMKVPIGCIGFRDAPPRLKHIFNR